jgi:hypothetical protein
VRNGRAKKALGVVKMQEEVDEFDDTSIAVAIHLREETKKSH